MNKVTGEIVHFDEDTEVMDPEKWLHIPAKYLEEVTSLSTTDRLSWAVRYKKAQDLRRTRNAAKRAKKARKMRRSTVRKKCR